MNNNWLVIEHRFDKEANLYQLTLGIPIVGEEAIIGDNGIALTDGEGTTFMRKVFQGWERIEQVVFSGDAKEHTHHAGRKLKPEKIRERHIKAVAEAWGLTTNEVDQPFPEAFTEAYEDWKSRHIEGS